MFALKVTECINRFLLWMAMLPAALYRKIGVNTSQLYTILQYKLILDNRRPLMLRPKSNTNKMNANATFSLLLISLIYGLLFLIAFSLNGLLGQMLLFFSMFIFMISSILINDFTEVLIDQRDANIISPKPVNDRTIIIAKVLHIFLNIFKLVVPMCLPSIVKILFLYSIWILLPFIAMIVLATLFTVFLINLLYVILLSFVSPTRFKSILSFIQIVFVIIIYASYQVIPKEIPDLNRMDWSQLSFIAFLPSFWFAACTDALYTLSISTTSWVIPLLAILMPFLSVWMMIKYLAPLFNQKLTGLKYSVPNKQTNKNVQFTPKRTYSSLMARIFTIHPVEKMGFLFSWKLSNRSKEFYMKVYPMFGYIVVLIVLLVFRKTHFNLNQIQSFYINNTLMSFWLICALYITATIASSALYQVVFSENYRAAWIFYSSPIAKPGNVLMGVAKMVTVKFFLPFALLFSILSFSFFGWMAIFNLLLCFSNIVLLILLMVLLNKKRFPFSTFQDAAQSSGNFMIKILRSLIFIVLIIIHLAVLKYSIVIYVLIALSLLANYLACRRIKRLSWNEMEQ